MEAPTNITELRRFMGMVNQKGKFSPNLAEITQPIRQLISKKSSLFWGPHQEQAFQRTKEELSKPTVLHLYNPQASTKISTDASCIIWLWGSFNAEEQLYLETCCLYIYASQMMTETKRKYAWLPHGHVKILFLCHN